MPRLDVNRWFGANEGSKGIQEASKYLPLMATGGSGGSGGGGPKSPKVMAQGGIGIANQPTSVVFGDAGPEAAFFMPLNGSSMGNLSTFGNMSSGGGSGGKTVVEIWLSPDLQSRIVNQAQAGIVDVIVKELA